MSVLELNRFKTCRCCLRELGSEEELHEFSSEVATDADVVNPQNFIKISECYLDLVGFTVSEEDEDNTKICSSCLGDLKFCFLFKRKCTENARTIEETQDAGKHVLLATLSPSNVYFLRILRPTNPTRA